MAQEMVWCYSCSPFCGEIAHFGEKSEAHHVILAAFEGHQRQYGYGRCKKSLIPPNIKPPLKVLISRPDIGLYDWGVNLWVCYSGQQGRQPSKVMGTVVTGVHFLFSRPLLPPQRRLSAASDAEGELHPLLCWPRQRHVPQDPVWPLQRGD